MSRIKELFSKTRAENRPAFVAYLTIGFPTSAESEKAAAALIENGADIIELGVPFSDPVADGETIRRAAAKSLENGVTLNDVFAIAVRLRDAHPSTPLVLFSYYNVIFSRGLKCFAAEAAAAGIDAVLAVDVPLEERGELLAALKPHGLTVVPLAAPNTPLERVSTMCEGLDESFLYAITVKGVTGARSELPKDVEARLREVSSAVSIPVVAGFGVSCREQAMQLGKACDGFVVGSAIVRELEKGIEKSDSVKRVAEFAKKLTAG